MASRGPKKHMKRMSAPKSIPIHDKKKNVWIIRPSPGPHNLSSSVSLGVLIREMLRLAKTYREIKNILSNRLVYVDGKCRTNPKFPVGFMDIISFSKLDRYFQIVVDNKGRLMPIEIDKKSSTSKIEKVVRKYTAKGNKIFVTFHDGRNLAADNNIHVGDGVVVELPEASLKKVLKLEKGAKCLVREGKHVGTIAVIEEIIKTKPGRPDEALLSSELGKFVTVLNYLFIVDDSFKGVQ